MPLAVEAQILNHWTAKEDPEGFKYEHVAETSHAGSLAEFLDQFLPAPFSPLWPWHHMLGQPPLGIPCLYFIRLGRKRTPVGRRGMEAGFQLKSKQSGSITLTR